MKFVHHAVGGCALRFYCLYARILKLIIVKHRVVNVLRIVACSGKGDDDAIYVLLRLCHDTLKERCCR